MDDLPRDLRLSSWIRGVVIAALILVYGWLVQDSRTSWTAGLLVGAALQFGILLMRKFLPRELLPQARFIAELAADGATVLLFAMGVLGGLNSFAQEL